MLVLAPLIPPYKKDMSVVSDGAPGCRRLVRLFLDRISFLVPCLPNTCCYSVVHRRASILNPPFGGPLPDHRTPAFGRVFLTKVFAMPTVPGLRLWFPSA
jgi:hypothetical protein